MGKASYGRPPATRAEVEWNYSDANPFAEQVRQSLYPVAQSSGWTEEGDEWHDPGSAPEGFYEFFTEKPWDGTWEGLKPFFDHKLDERFGPKPEPVVPDTSAYDAAMESMNRQVAAVQEQITNLPTVEDLRADRAAEEAAEAAERDKAELAAIYGERTKAETLAMDFVDQYVGTELSRSRLFGTSVSFDAESVQGMYQGRFTDLWTKKNEDRLAELEALYGEVAGAKRLTLGTAGFSVSKRATPAAPVIRKPELEDEDGIVLLGV